MAGVIGETTFKFFIQYSSWAAVYCIYVLVITAIVIAEERTKVSLLFPCLVAFAPPNKGPLEGFHRPHFSPKDLRWIVITSQLCFTLSKP